MRHRIDRAAARAAALSAAAARISGRIIGTAGLQTHCQMCWDAGASTSYGGSGQTITDLSGNGMNFYLGATRGAEASDPVFHGSIRRLVRHRIFSPSARRAGGRLHHAPSGEYLTLAEANPAWVSALHQGARHFTVAALIYFPGHPGGR